MVVVGGPGDIGMSGLRELEVELPKLPLSQTNGDVSLSVHRICYWTNLDGSGHDMMT